MLTTKNIRTRIFSFKKQRGKLTFCTYLISLTSILKDVINNMNLTGQRNPPRGCGESPFASKLPESAWGRRLYAR